MSHNKRHIVLHAEGVHKTFYRPKQVNLLKGVNLIVERGQAVAITGRSGEGKSTLLQLLGTLESPCSGTVEIANQKVTRFNRDRIRNRHIAFVFQAFYLLEDYTALENVLMPARIARQDVTKGSAAYRRGCDLLDRVGLADRMGFTTKLLSGGEKQRVAIARALCNDPDLILADEPSGNLDRDNASSIHSMLLDFARQNHKAVIIVTHDQHLAQLCDAEYVLSEGLLYHKNRE